jgi:hypothetical protein
MIWYTDNGTPLSLDFGAGLTSSVSFTIPPNGTYVLQSRIASAVTTTGWAFAAANLPVLANVAFRLIQKGVAKLEITAEPSQPSYGYKAVAGPLVGIAVANVYNSTPLSATVAVYDRSGSSLGQASLTIPPFGHAAFILNQLIPSLPRSFTGSLSITPQTQGYSLLAWAVYAGSSGVISTLPDGRSVFPGPHVDEVETALLRLVTAYQTYVPDFGPAPQLTDKPRERQQRHQRFSPRTEQSCRSTSRLRS